MSETKYPVYRMFKNGKVVMKLNGDGVLIRVNMVKENDFSIIHTKNSILVGDFNNPHISFESTRDEFEKVYDQAWFQLSKANIEQ